MIDVFMLAREGIISHDDEYGQLSDVVFCESNQEDYPEITEMIGIEGSGFHNELETLVLFQDTEYTSEFPDLRSIQLELENEELAPEHRDMLMLKRQHLEFKNKFPFDFLNLDFCGYYYPIPPGILQINETVERIVDLQTRETYDQDENRISVNEFVLAVTCRFDDEVPEEAFRRLQRIIADNRDGNHEYSQALLASRGTTSPEDWRGDAPYDFFLGSWPKELLRLARDRGWNMHLEDYFHYQRTNNEGIVYHIVSVICHLERHPVAATYLAESIRILSPGSRVFIDEISRRSAVGRALLRDLNQIVTIRNERASKVGRELLPVP